ncbi:pentatricopeptide repeat-containing protein At3g21470-like [Aristolochia californica]|uniref:pentatricopeptide repeat-containing protein At3g21470-like n=1 Tax=Aristolochia californica TaxID=171875 RepID=UPI0035DDEDF8
MQKGALVDRQIGANLEEIRKIEDDRQLLDEMAEIKVEYWNPMLRSLMFLGRVDLAHQVFDNMLFRDLMLWNSVIMSYAKGVNWTETFDVVFGTTKVDDYGKSSEAKGVNWTETLAYFVPSVSVDVGDSDLEGRIQESRQEEAAGFAALDFFHKLFCAAIVALQKPVLPIVALLKTVLTVLRVVASVTCGAQLYVVVDTTDTPL